MQIIAALALTAFAALAPVTLAPAVAAGHDDAAFAAPTFEAIDADGDALLTRDEIGAWFASDDPAMDAFDVFDTDGDGTVTPSEFDALCFEPETGMSV